METRFLVIFAFLYFLQILDTSSNTMIMNSSNVTCTERERQSLLAFKHILTDKANVLSTWRGAECCKWKGVGCDNRNGHVVKLDLRAPVSFNYTQNFNDKFLEGELSPSLQNLKHLRYLDLSMNHFSGNIPEFLGSFKRLQYLNLSSSGLGGVVPHHLGNLSRLKYLDLRIMHVMTRTNYDHHTGVQFIFSSKAPIIDDLGWLSSLSSLRHLDLSGLIIGEHIDWFHPVNMLPSLLTLNLAYSYITNIPSTIFVNSTSLNSLDLSLNYISSTIPVWLSNLTGLVHLDLSGNMFSGPIPTSLGQLSRLEDLYLYDNQLSGNIPMSLGKLSKLKNLDLSLNSLVGILSETHFTKLRNLNNLVLSSNLLTLNFSSKWITPFELQIFLAGSCNIGPHFPNWLQTQTNLQRLDLYNSSIRDTIPEWFENILSHIFYLDLSNNYIRGILPRFVGDGSKQIENRILKMNSNKFEGSLDTFPSNVYFLDLSDNLLSGHVPQTDKTMNPSLQVVDLSKNCFSGSIPAHLCKVPSIEVLDLSQNKFSGRLPGCLGNLTNLRVIDFANNTITGVVPSSLGSLNFLESLHLHTNRFEGDIPDSFQNLTRLVTMDLGNNLFMGSIPFWIGEKLSLLRSLNLQSNKFTGNIPLQLCQPRALQYLSLAHNKIGGTIPRCFGNLSGMITNSGDDFYTFNYEENILASIKGKQLVYTKTIKFLTSLDLSSNNIIGEIPDALMYLVGLKNLNLSGNLITGQIPMIIGDLEQLESLDLSMNKLSGRIPQSLGSLHFLSYLNLSFNNLSGPIPVGNQIQTLDDMSIYEGNNRLCGPPVSRSCNGNGVTYNHVGDNEGQDDTQSLWFYAGMGPGFVVGFIGLLGSLHCIMRWRVAYFEMLEKVYGWLTVSILLNLARLRRKVFE